MTLDDEEWVSYLLTHALPEGDSNFLLRLLDEAQERKAEVLELSPREKQVARMVRDGMKEKEIAKQLGISASGAKHYLLAVYRKLDVEGRVQLAAELLLPLDSPLRKKD